MAWLFLIGAIITEVSGTLALRMAALGGRGWFAVVGVGYVLAFTLLALALGAGMALGVAYGIWSAVGIVATAVLSRILFREPLTKLMLGGMGLIVVGVLLVELGGAH